MLQAVRWPASHSAGMPACLSVCLSICPPLPCRRAPESSGMSSQATTATVIQLSLPDTPPGIWSELCLF